MAVSLTQEERDKFATYLEQLAESVRLLVVQSRRFGLPEAFSQMLQTEAIAADLIAGRLRPTKTVGAT